MDRWDLLVLVGIALLAAGLYLLAPWLGLATAGLLLTAAGLAGATRAENRAARPGAQPRGE